MIARSFIFCLLLLTLSQSANASCLGYLLSFIGYTDPEVAQKVREKWPEKPGAVFHAVLNEGHYLLRRGYRKIILAVYYDRILIRQGGGYLFGSYLDQMEPISIVGAGRTIDDYPYYAWEYHFTLPDGTAGNLHYTENWSFGRRGGTIKLGKAVYTIVGGADRQYR